METYADHKVMPGFGNNMMSAEVFLSLMMINVFLSILLLMKMKAMGLGQIGGNKCCNDQH